ncbi:MAG: hypothetical protein R3343_06305 [Nitriliruptorales bacterium]|nr:hypothetical protein [Nitriliruptorales bacterium]
MVLEPGDRGILSVAPWDGAADLGATWSCSRCGRRFDARESWRVDYDHPDGDHFTFVVCRACADELRPVRVVVDLGALAGYDGEEDLSPLVSLVETILTLRGPPSDGVLNLRWADVHMLAETFGLTPRRLSERLHDAGVVLPDGGRDNPFNGRSSQLLGGARPDPASARQQPPEPTDPPPGTPTRS